MIFFYNLLNKINEIMMESDDRLQKKYRIYIYRRRVWKTGNAISWSRKSPYYKMFNQTFNCNRCYTLGNKEKNEIIISIPFTNNYDRWIIWWSEAIPVTGFAVQQPDKNINTLTTRLSTTWVIIVRFSMCALFLFSYIFYSKVANFFICELAFSEVWS